MATQATAGKPANPNVAFKKRLLDRNRGDSPHAAKFTPWEIVTCFAIHEKDKAVAFEKYLKSGSGRAFAKRHFS